MYTWIKFIDALRNFAPFNGEVVRAKRRRFYCQSVLYSCGADRQGFSYKILE